MVASSPDHVYKWDWSAVTPVNISGSLNPFSTGDNLMQPSLVCDSKDRLHLAAIHYVDSADEYSVVYTMKEVNQSWVAMPSGRTGTWVDGRWVVVRTATPDHDIDLPKICLRGDDLPYV